MAHTVLITRDYDHLSEVAAQLIEQRLAATLAARGSAVLGLATGSSPTGAYKHLAKACNAGRLDATKIRSFNLDEYIGLPGANAQARALHPESYTFFMIQELFGLLRHKFAAAHVPAGCLIEQDKLEAELAAHPGDWQEAGADKGRAILIRPAAESAYLRWIRTDILDAYEQDIRRAGGIDLHVIGVGGRGHVAFHECGIPFAGNRMLLVKLDDNTVANAVRDHHFARAADSPRFAISMGAELVYEAKSVVLLAAGARKTEPMAAALAEAPSPAVPISYGQLYAQRGGEMIYVIDRAAATGVLERRNEIAARGIEIRDLSDAAATCPLASLAFTRDPATGLLG